MPNSPIFASCCSAESCFQQNSLDEFPTSGREFITALRRPAVITDGLELFFYF